MKILPKTSSAALYSISIGIVLICLTIGFFSLHHFTAKFSISPVIEPAFNRQNTLLFIENQGQVDPAALYHARGLNHAILFYENKIEISRLLTETHKNELHLSFEGANPKPIVAGKNMLNANVNFFQGNDSNHWYRNLACYGTVYYADLYPGIDMAYLGQNGILESEFYVADQADYRQIQIHYQGLNSITIDKAGALLMETDLGTFVEKKPYAYQVVNGVEKEVKANYQLLAENTVGFKLGRYDKNLPLVIDPELVFFTTIEGFGGEWTTGIVMDSQNNLILAGAANRFFPAMDTIPESNHAGGLGNDGWLVKLDGQTGEVIYSALFGGSRYDIFEAIAIDKEDNLYLTGPTASDDFPTLNAFQDTLNDGDDAFLVKLNAEGELTYSSYFGGSGDDYSTALATDDFGNAYLTGRTTSDDLYVDGGFQTLNKGGANGSDAFVVKFNPTGGISYSTYLGGDGNEYPLGISVTESGMVTITGNTASTDFPLSNAYQNTFGGGNAGLGEGDVFISRLNAAGTDLVYSTYFGGSEYDWAKSISKDTSGSVFIAGGTLSDDFPVVNGNNFPETDSADGILIALDKLGQAKFALRSNQAGADEFDAVFTADTNRYFVTGVQNNNVEIFEKQNDSVVLYYTNSLQLSYMNDIFYTNGNLAITGTYWPPDSKIENFPDQDETRKLMSSGSQAQAAYIRVLELAKPYSFSLNTCQLAIQMMDSYDPDAYEMVLGSDADGNVTINGKSIGIHTSEVCELVIHGTYGDDNIDLTGVRKEKFPNIDPDIPILIYASDGYNRVKGSLEFRNNINGGRDIDIITGGNLADEITDYLGDNEIDGGDGENTIYTTANNGRVELGNDNDYITFFEAIFVGEKQKFSATSTNRYLLGDEEIFALTDRGGFDTLSFSEYGQGIMLNLSSVLTQVIDTSGTSMKISGKFETFKGSGFADSIAVSPDTDTVLFIDGAEGIDVLDYYTSNSSATDDGSSIKTDGFADVNYVNIEAVNINTEAVTTNENYGELLEYGLQTVYPNPLQSISYIRFTVQKAATVKLSIYNSTGVMVKNLTNRKILAGSHVVAWNGQNDQGADLGSGIYFCVLEFEGFLQSRKIVLLK